MKKYVTLNSDNSVYSISDVGLSSEDIEVEVPDDFDDMQIFKYRYEDGKLVEDDELISKYEESVAISKNNYLQQSQMLNLIEMFVAPKMADATFDYSSATKVSSFAEEWSGDGVKYIAGQIRKYKGKLYIVNEGQSHTSQPAWDPASASSLWSEIKIAPDGNREWVQPAGAHDCYAENELCWYPQYEGGTLYISKQNGNIWPPNDTPTSTWKIY